MVRMDTMVLPICLFRKGRGLMKQSHCTVGFVYLIYAGLKFTMAGAHTVFIQFNQSGNLTIIFTQVMLNHGYILPIVHTVGCYGSFLNNTTLNCGEKERKIRLGKFVIGKNVLFITYYILNESIYLHARI